MFGALVNRLFDLQIINGESYQENYTGKTTVTVDTDYTRGEIYDRNGNVLAYNKLAYNVELIDKDDYTAYERNIMIMRLIEILDAHGETVNSVLSLDIDEDDKYVFTTTTESALIRFLKDIYGDDTYAENEEKGKTVDDYTPDEVVETLKERYGIGYTDSTKKETYEVDKATALKMVNIRYALALNRYKKYVSSTVAVDVSEETVSDIMEHEYELLGVSIEQQSVREYTDAKYFSHIIGYTGTVSTDELATLQEEDDTYTATDIVGKSGIEYSMESVLKGTKGSKTINIDRLGTLVEVLDEEEAQAGEDVYLTIDADLTKAVYSILEQHLAGILVSKIVNSDVTITDSTVASEIKIGIKDVYFQLINNNILSMSHFYSDEATDTEKGIYSKFKVRKEEAIEKICDILLNESDKSNDSYSEEIQGYISYTYSMLKEENILDTDKIDTSDSVYKKWENDKISFYEFLSYALSNSWIDVTKLNLSNKYSTSEESFESLIALIRENLTDDSSFNKEVYRYLIEDGEVTGRELCLALFDQAVLAYDEDEYNKLSANGEVYAYNFIKKKIQSIEITPAQLALDPCSGSVVVTDVNNGDVLALVSYPSYDNNQITTDTSYLRQLNSDLSSPLYNRATQTKIAPGSIFKMITAFAGLEEGVINTGSTITAADNGIFNKSNIQVKCAISPSSHGTLDIQAALQKSCNYFFCEVGYRLSQNSKGKYSSSIGLQVIQKYSEMFGLGEKTGIEISEASPHVTEIDPVQSSIGQGSHAYTNTQMNRYLLTLASRGTVQKLNLVKKTVDSDGEVTKKYKQEVIRELDFSQDEWDTVWQGMYQVVNSSTQYSSWFKAVTNVTVAGKTGTAQENKKRGNHANFISFAPYDDPEVAISVSIPYGYTAANAVSVAKDVWGYYFSDDKNLEEIMAQDGSNISGVSVDD
jgi:penicillin-binding protein 2